MRGKERITSVLHRPPAITDKFEVARFDDVFPTAMTEHIGCGFRWH